MADAPWIKWFTGDFLGGIGAFNMKADEIGVYAVILNLMAERGSAIEDDRQWLAGRCGCTTRRLNQIIQRLVEIGKIQIQQGRITNKRMLAEVEYRGAKSDQARQAVEQRWERERQRELALEDKNRQKKPRKNEEKTEINRRKNEELSEINQRSFDQFSQNSANSEHTDVSSTVYTMDDTTRARDSEHQRFRIKQTNIEPRNEEARETKKKEPDVRYDDQSFDTIFGAVCFAAGHSPPDDGIDRSKDYIRRWRDAGISVDDIILPTIQRIMASSPDVVTSSLKRFDREIMGAAAQNSARKAQKAKPLIPVYEIPEEDRRMVAVRKDIHKKIGSAYPAMATHFRLDVDDDNIIRISGMFADRLKDEAGPKYLAACAHHWGFDGFR